MSTTVSIIIVTFNASKTLRVALDSVKNQTYQKWECIVVDGASKDNTLEIVQQYALEDFRFRVISEPDRGIYDAMNKGWKMASGEWILYLGADDELISSGIENLIIRSQNSDIIYGDTILKFNSSEKIQKSQNHKVLKKKMCCCHQSVLIKRDVLKELNGFNTKYVICSDFDMMQRAFLRKYKFTHIHFTISKFSLTGLSAFNTHGIFEQQTIRHDNQSMNKILLKIYNFYQLVRHKLILFYYNHKHILK